MIKLKRYLLLGIICGLCLLSSGCSGDVTLAEIAAYTDNGESAFDAVRERNVKFIKDLQNAGFLSESQANDWTESVETKMEAIKKEFKGGAATDASKKVSEQILSAVTKDVEATYAKQLYFDVETGQLIDDNSENYYYTDYCPGDGKEHSKRLATAWTLYDEDTCDEEYGEGDKKHTCGAKIHNYRNDAMFLTIRRAYSSDGIDDLKKKAKGEAFPLFDATQAQQLRDALGRPIYVINNFEGDKTPEKLQITIAILQNDRTSAEELVQEYDLSNAILGNYKVGELIPNMGSLKEEVVQGLEDYLLTYCTPAKDSAGNPVTYLTVNTYDKQKRVDDAGNPYIFADTWAGETEDFVDPERTIGNKVDGTETLNSLGKDVVITSSGRISLQIRIMEFNPDLINLIKGNSDNTGCKGKYYLTDKASSKAAIKLDYPLYKIDSIKTEEKSSKDWWCTISDTGLTMDLTDGHFYDDENYPLNYAGDFDMYGNGSTLFWSSDHVDLKDSSSATVEMVLKKDDNGNDVKIKVRPLVLKDYIELYHIVDSEGKGLYDRVPEDKQEYWAAIGRRLRVKQFQGGENDIKEFAQSLTLEGNVLDSPNFISLDKIADRTSGYGFYENVAEKLGLGLDNNATVQAAINGTDGTVRTGKLVDASGFTLEDTGLNFGMEAYFEYINPTICLGTELDTGGDSSNGVIKNPPLAQLDHSKVYEKSGGGTYMCPTLYGICIATSINDMNLTGGDWIGGSDDACKNIKSWNGWLSTNFFSYFIDIERLLSLLGIQSEMMDSGDTAIIFDPETIKVIQDTTDEKVEVTLLRNLRTISRIFGFLISTYGLILMGAWVFDTNIYMGTGLLKILTFGKWVAIRDSSDMPTIDNDEVQYIDLKKLIVSVSILMAIGAMLTFVDFYDFKAMTEKYVGSLMNKLKELLIGG